MSKRQRNTKPSKRKAKQDQAFTTNHRVGAQQYLAFTDLQHTVAHSQMSWCEAPTSASFSSAVASAGKSMPCQHSETFSDARETVVWRTSARRGAQQYLAPTDVTSTIHAHTQKEPGPQVLLLQPSPFPSAPPVCPCPAGTVKALLRKFEMSWPCNT